MCQNCELRGKNLAQYRLRMEWLECAQFEEFYQKQGELGLQEFYKEKRLKLEREMRS